MHWRPPIGSDLFADRQYFGQFIDKYWWVRPLVSRFRNAKDSVTLEAELEEIQDASKGRVLTREQLFALRYYLQRVISGTCQEWSNRIHGNTNYVRLVDDIDSMWTHGPGKGKPVTFATFNYDVLLDGALGQIGVKVGQSLESYTEHPQYKLIKPHGSVNWFHHVPDGRWRCPTRLTPSRGRRHRDDGTRARRSPRGRGSEGPCAGARTSAPRRAGRQ